MYKKKKKNSSHKTDLMRLKMIIIEAAIRHVQDMFKDSDVMLLFISINSIFAAFKAPYPISCRYSQMPSLLKRGKIACE